ncbi:hypothetical protein [Pararhizobium sp. A13]|uniref:hypothetical protein n=1 Tax=Pararhizobium sp. A13 TaxID=3133975 RepID=UPI003246FB2C
MRWQIMNGGIPTEGVFDDNIPLVGPGDEGFTTDLVAAEAARVGASGWNYTGPSESHE